MTRSGFGGSQARRSSMWRPGPRKRDSLRRTEFGFKSSPLADSRRPGALCPTLDASRLGSTRRVSVVGETRAPTALLYPEGATRSRCAIQVQAWHHKRYERRSLPSIRRCVDVQLRKGAASVPGSWFGSTSVRSMIVIDPWTGCLVGCGLRRENTAGKAERQAAAAAGLLPRSFERIALSSTTKAGLWKRLLDIP